jgi:dinuclear metal center YbgI/SA1388 family protein
MAEKKPISRNKLVNYLDTYLAVSSITDDAHNGLQVEGTAKISKAAFAVDACLQTVKLAARKRTNILIVHHGFYWAGHNQPITGIMKDRVSILLSNQISLYASHLPLDAHDDIGNNVMLAKLLGLDILGKYASYKNVEIGVLAEPKKSLKRSELVRKLDKTLHTRAKMLSFGPSTIKKVGIVSGDGAFALAETKKKGADTFITGETEHIAYHYAKEAKVNMICAGHYATETVGVKALADHLQDKFSMDCEFISAPTGL